ncbi:MAG: InlB B-repeat-containing protein [Clostridium sp.]|nr:InlB B-repeat-containing protein [Clostridium sp.]
MKSTAKKITKRLIIIALSLAALLLVGAVLLPNFVPQSSGIYQILRLQGEGEDDVSETGEPPELTTEPTTVDEAATEEETTTEVETTEPTTEEPTTEELTTEEPSTEEPTTEEPTTEEPTTEEPTTAAPQTVSVTLDFGGVLENVVFEKLPGEALTLPAVEPIISTEDGAHYRFDGWSQEPEVFPEENIVITASFTTVYRVEFTGVEPAPAAVYLESGESVDFPEIPTPAGCFSSWTLGGEDIDEYTVEGSDLSFAAALRTTYAVKLLGQSLLGEYDEDFGEYSLAAAVGAELTQDEILAQIDGQTEFEGFTIVSAASFTVPASADGVVEVKYERNKYTLSFYGYNDELFSREELYYGAELAAPAEKPQRTGYHFSYWLDFPDEPTTMGLEPLAFYAHFDPNEDTAYTVRLLGEALPNGEPVLLGTKLLAGTSDEGITAAAVIAELEALGEDTEFAGFSYVGAEPWSIAPDGSGVYDIAYSRNSYTLTLVELETLELYGEETQYKTELSVPYGQVLELPGSVEHRLFGQRFDSWEAHDAAMPADDLTITAQYVPDSYEVYFLNYDGTEIEKLTVVFGQEIPETQFAAERLGYHFTHWALTQDSDTLPCEDDVHAVEFGPSNLLQSEGLSYYAHFDPNEDTAFKLLFLGEGVDPATSAPLGEKELSGTTDAEIAFDTAWLEGVEFDGFEFSAPSEGSIIIAADGTAVFNVLFIRKSYELKLLQLDDKEKYLAVQVRYGTPLDEYLSAFEAASAESANTAQYCYGKAFDSWTDENGDAVATAGLTMPHAAKSLYAVYHAAQWTASFKWERRDSYAAGLTQQTETQGVLFEEQITAPTADVRKYGYSLSGWRDDATGTLYQPDELVMDKEGRSFTAVWQANSYTATFIYQTDEGPQTVTQDFVFDSAIAFPVKDVPQTADTISAWQQETGRVQTGHELTAWVWNDGSKDISVSAAAQAAMLLEGGMTFTAAQPVLKYDVVFNWTGGTKTIKVAYGADIYAAVKAAGFEWYWEKLIDGVTKNNLVDFNKATIKAERVGYSIDKWEEQYAEGADRYGDPHGDTTFGIMSDCKRIFNAVERALSYKVKFYRIEANGTLNPVGETTATFNGYFALPVLYDAGISPAKYFKGWCLDTTLKTIVADINVTSYKLTTKGLELYARYDCPISYYIDDILTKEIAVTQGTTISLWSAPAKTGYHFSGWYADKELKNKESLTGKSMPDGPQNVYGKYEINTFTVQFKYKDSKDVWQTSAKVSYTYGQKLALPSGVPTSPNTTTQKFTGWKTSYDSSAVTIGTTTAKGAHGASIVITAQYATRKVQSIEAALPTGTTFPQGKLIDLAASGITFYVTYDNGVKEQKTDIIALIKNGSVTYTPQSIANAGGADITLTYKDASSGETASCKLRVQITPRQPLTVSVSTLPKTSYYVGEKLDLTGGKLEIRYDNTTKEYINLTDSKVTVSNFDSTKTGERILTVKYTGTKTLTTEYKIKIVTKPVTWPKGDANNDGKLNSLDLLLIKRHILEISKLSGNALKAADIDGNGKVNSVDVMRLLRHILNIEKIK